VALDDRESYCRQVEAYLCRKNDGHLVRIVGPAFEQVMGWSTRGIPIRVVFHGIDRYFERYYAKGPRRRPARIEFCEADVLDAFDEWRRAIGITNEARVAPTGTSGSQPAEETTRRHESLPAHLERVIARLTTLRGGADRSLDGTLDAVIRELDGRLTESRTLRGDARRAFVDRLSAIDGELLNAVKAQCDAPALAQLGAEADEELAPFKDRLSSAAFADARRAAMDRLMRERRRLPVIAFD